MYLSISVEFTSSQRFSILSYIYIYTHTIFPFSCPLYSSEKEIAREIELVNGIIDNLLVNGIIDNLVAHQ